MAPETALDVMTTLTWCMDMDTDTGAADRHLSDAQQPPS